eukprot:GSA25T00018737001.1
MIRAWRQALAAKPEPTKNLEDIWDLPDYGFDCLSSNDTRTVASTAEVEDLPTPRQPRGLLDTQDFPEPEVGHIRLPAEVHLQDDAFAGVQVLPRGEDEYEAADGLQTLVQLYARAPPPAVLGGDSQIATHSVYPDDEQELQPRIERGDREAEDEEEGDEDDDEAKDLHFRCLLREIAQQRREQGVEVDPAALSAELQEEHRNFLVNFDLSVGGPAAFFDDTHDAD